MLIENYEWVAKLGNLVIEEGGKVADLLYLCMLRLSGFSVVKLSKTIAFLKSKNLFEKEIKQNSGNLLHMAMSARMSNDERCRVLNELHQINSPRNGDLLLQKNEEDKNVFESAFFKLDFEPIFIILRGKNDQELFFQKFLEFSKDSHQKYLKNCEKFLCQSGLIFKACKSASFENIKWAIDVTDCFEGLLKLELGRIYQSRLTVLSRLLLSYESTGSQNTLLKTAKLLFEKGFPLSLLDQKCQINSESENCYQILERRKEDSDFFNLLEYIDSLQK